MTMESMGSEGGKVRNPLEEIVLYDLYGLSAGFAFEVERDSSGDYEIEVTDCNIGQVVVSVVNSDLAIALAAAIAAARTIELAVQT